MLIHVAYCRIKFDTTGRSGKGPNAIGPTGSFRKMSNEAPSPDSFADAVREEKEAIHQEELEKWQGLIKMLAELEDEWTKKWADEEEHEEMIQVQDPRQQPEKDSRREARRKERSRWQRKWVRLIQYVQEEVNYEEATLGEYGSNTGDEAMENAD